MKKEITLGNLLTVATTVVLAFLAAWITMNNKVAEMKVKQAEDEKRYYDSQIANDRKADRIEAKMDKLFDVMNDLSIKVENKVTRQ